MDSKSDGMIFLFGEGDLPATILGGKGEGLSRMVRLGLPVSPGFTVTTAFSQDWNNRRTFSKCFLDELSEGMVEVEFRTGMKFGDPSRPLLVSVRSGAPVSMPGMMDTVLNVGLNPETVEGLATLFESGFFAWDSYRRFLSMYGETVLGISKDQFEKVLRRFRGGELKLKVLKKICSAYRQIISTVADLKDLDDPWYQLKSTLIAVMRSWNNKRAQDYRQAHNISDYLGTAINVQAMVFGNLDNDSGTGVVFSRNVSTGEPGLYGEFLVNAQGEDVVAGTRTPLPIAKMKEWNVTLYTQLAEIVDKLERYYNEVVDVEFTVESGELYILQVRVAKRTPEAAMTIAVHFVQEGRWLKEEAVKKVSYSQVVAVKYHSSFDPAALARAVDEPGRLLGKGLSASPGAAVGEVVFDSETAEKKSREGIHVVLVRPDTSPDDLSGMLAAVAIVTETGGSTSHAAVVARSLGKPAVVGSANLHVEEGQIVSVDGASGLIISGEVPWQEKIQTKEIEIFLGWVGMELSPPPRLALEFIDQSLSLNRLVNDFYLLDAMDQAAVGTDLELEVHFIRCKTHNLTAEIIAAYLAVAVAGELRHYAGNCTAFQILSGKYGVQRMPEREFYRAQAQEKVIQKIKTMGVEEQRRFFHLAEQVFDDRGQFPGKGYGGGSWAKIAKAGYLYLSGEVNSSTFADHAFDLQHNNGSVFGKHRMLIGDRSLLSEQLAIKKVALGVADLYRSLSRVFYYNVMISPEVVHLYQKGVSRNWFFDKSARAA